MVMAGGDDPLAVDGNVRFQRLWEGQKKVCDVSSSLSTSHDSPTSSAPADFYGLSLTVQNWIYQPSDYK